MTQQIQFHGNPIHIHGQISQPGDSAKPFKLIAKDLSEVELSSLVGKRKVLNIFPSIDTGVCATSVRKFNQYAASLENCAVLCISADLPFAQSRFCGTEGLNNVITLSTFRAPSFKQDYGVEIIDGPLAGLTARAIIILDSHDKVVYSQLVDEITHEPDYDAALAVLK